MLLVAPVFRVSTLKVKGDGGGDGAPPRCAPPIELPAPPVTTFAILIAVAISEQCYDIESSIRARVIHPNNLKRDGSALHKVVKHNIIATRCSNF